MRFMDIPQVLPPTTDRVPRATSSRVNARIRRETRERILKTALKGNDAISRRLRELDREWDIERTLEANAATIALTGTILGATVDRRFYLLPAAVTTFLLQHALQGWCPPLPLFRRAGVRTAQEIEEERYALKVLRGDFDDVAGDSSPDRAAGILEPVMRAVRK